MTTHADKIAHTMDFPPDTAQPNVYPLSWRRETEKMEEIWQAAQREQWDAAALPWDTFDVSKYTMEQREAIAYWWTLLSVFDASAPPVFAVNRGRMRPLFPAPWVNIWRPNSNFSAVTKSLLINSRFCPA